MCANVALKFYPFFSFQITEIDGDEVEVIFMENKGSFYAWPSVQKKSWENVSAIKKILSDPVLSANSTNDRQYFKF